MRELLMDPKDIDKYHLRDYSSIWDFAPADRSKELKILRTLSERLSNRDKELYNMYYIDNITQADIAEYYGITQCHIHFRLKKVNSRLQILNELPVVDWLEIWSLLSVDLNKSDKFIYVISTFLNLYNHTTTANIITEKYGRKFIEKQSRSMVKTALKLLSLTGRTEAHDYLALISKYGNTLQNRESK